MRTENYSIYLMTLSVKRKKFLIDLPICPFDFCAALSIPKEIFGKVHFLLISEFRDC